MTIYDDAFDARLVQGATGVLREFNAIGLVLAADVHVARRLCALAGEPDETVALAVAMAVRAPRLGHVYVDLATIAGTATVDTEEPVDLTGLPWPEPAAWVAAVARSPLTATGDGEAAAAAVERSPSAAASPPTGAGAARPVTSASAPAHGADHHGDFGAGSRHGIDVGPDPTLARPTGPLRLVGTALYLDRYWREERRLAEDLRAFRAAPVGGVDETALAAGLERLFDAGRQRDAAEAAVRRRLAVVAGGPGTGKTTTVAGIVALLTEQRGDPLIALAAPTGKAANRLGEAVHEQARLLAVDAPVRDRLLALEASTVHRLLGWRPGGRFRHHRGNRLPHDVVIVDETSMVSLSMMARLVEAVRADARLVLVGDPGQLTSIEAGAVLGDIVGTEPHDGIVVLTKVHRFDAGGGISRVAQAVHAGDADAVIAVLRAGHADLTWFEDPEAPGTLDRVRVRAVAAARAVVAAARDGRPEDALTALGAFRLLCAHRRGEHGVSSWLAAIEAGLGDLVQAGRFYPGRPLLVTENDYALRLFNGDTGVVVGVGDDGAVAAAFERGGETVLVRPSRLAAVDTVYAMTVHKSQGSQFGTVAVVLPPPASQILTRELLYTAVTRARAELILVGSEETIRAAVARPAARASGLARRLWGG